MKGYKQEKVKGHNVIKTFVIRNKKTKDLWRAASGKTSWKAPNHAKSAFTNSHWQNKRDPALELTLLCADLGRYESLKFNDQDVYEIVELLPEDVKADSGVVKDLEKAKKLLKSVLERLDKIDSCYSRIEQDIEEFLEGE